MALNNIDFTKDRYKEQLAALEVARLAKGLTYAELAEQLGVSKIFIASTLDGQQILPAATAEKLADILGVSKDATAFLTEHPYKGNIDPLLYRFYEAIETYGPAIKKVIEEEFDDGNGCGGNGIMSAIDFKVDVEKEPNPKGDRVIIKFSGKFLPYSYHGEYPW